MGPSKGYFRPVDLTSPPPQGKDADSSGIADELAAVRQKLAMEEERGRALAQEAEGLRAALDEAQKRAAVPRGNTLLDGRVVLPIWREAL